MKQYLILLWLFFSLSVQAGVITDGSLGQQVHLTGVDYAITQELGQLQGSNLFHSFSQFSLSEGESATFSGDSSIQAVFSRVTGGQTSSIEGTIRNTIPNADLYLMNPAGILFSKGANLDLQGSFYATTADVIQFTNGNNFNAQATKDVLLSAAEPSAFGFLDNEIGQLDVLKTNLTIPIGETLALIGHDIDISETTLSTPAGTLYLASIASSGEISLQPQANSTTTAFGDMRLTQRASLNANYNELDQLDLKKGGIFIRAGVFEAINSSITAAAQGYSIGGDIDIKASQFNAQSTDITSRNRSLATGGNISIQVEDQAIFGDDTNLENRRVTRTTVSTSNLDSNIQAGDSGSIMISATDIHITDGTLIESIAQGHGQGGAISLTASNNIVMQGQNIEGKTSALSSSSRPIQTTSEIGDGNNINITAKNFVMQEGANITANTLGSGQGGNINLNLTGNLTMEKESTQGIGSFMSAGTTSKNPDAGHGGNIVIQAHELLFANGSFLTTNTSGAGNAGSITVNVAHHATIGGTSQKTDSGILSSADRLSVGGNAGSISLNVGNQLFLGELAIIDASTFGSGLGGNVDIVAGDIVMRNQAYIGAVSGNTGNTGDIRITITNDNLEMYDKSSITTDAEFADGGNIMISMPNYLYVSSESDVTTSIRSGVGGGGNIDLDAEFTVLDGGKILAQAYGGPGGNIDIVTTSIYNLTNQPIEQVISASSKLGIDGVVTVRSPDSDTDESVVILSGNFLQADKLLHSLCDKKRSQGNSFVVTGRESYPNLVDDWLPSNAAQLVLQRCEL